jgi:hypothetical protein
MLEPRTVLIQFLFSDHAESPPLPPIKEDTVIWLNIVLTETDATIWAGFIYNVLDHKFADSAISSHLCCPIRLV